MGRQFPDTFIGLFILTLLLSSCGEFTGLKKSDTPVTGLNELRLYVPEDELNTLYDSVSLDLYANCRFENDGSPALPDAAGAEIRVRGFTSRMNPKKSFTLRWSEGGEEKKIALDAGGDPWISYALAMHAYHLAGLPSLELSPIALFMNGEYLGYYNTLPLYDEGVDDFFDEDGELFKIRAFDLGRDIPAQSMSEKAYPDDDDYSALSRYLVNAAHMSRADWVVWAEANVDLEDLARYMAVRDYIGMADTYETNFYVYAGEKYRIIPWDNDHYFAYEAVGGNNILTTRMLESDAFARLYKETFNDLFLRDTDDNIIASLALFADNMYDTLQLAVDSEPVFYLKREDFESEKDFVDSFLQNRSAEILSDPQWSDFFENDGDDPAENGD